MYKFDAILKSTIWGGEEIVPFKHLHSQQRQVGESWEISAVQGFESHVSEGIHKGLSISQLVSIEQGRLLGEDNYRRFGNEFPLLVKFIDAHDDLSIQVHPNNEVARRHGERRGKTEMWYALHCDPAARLYNGLREEITPEEYKRRVEEGTICEALAQYPVQEGDVFFIPAGRIHSIGKGCMVVEIQETSDVTYRIYDFKRKDKDGHYRQLHIREASESIDYHVLPDYRTHYTPRKNEGVTLIQCPCFTTSVYDLDEPMTLDYSELDSFVILIAVSGECTLTDEEGQTVSLRAGETVLVPASTRQIDIQGTVKLLETYI